MRYIINNYIINIISNTIHKDKEESQKCKQYKFKRQSIYFWVISVVIPDFSSGLILDILDSRATNLS